MISKEKIMRDLNSTCLWAVQHVGQANYPERQKEAEEAVEGACDLAFRRFEAREKEMAQRRKGRRA
jgi:hypothetical protein